MTSLQISLSQFQRQLVYVMKDQLQCVQRHSTAIPMLVADVAFITSQKRGIVGGLRIRDGRAGIAPRRLVIKGAIKRGAFLSMRHHAWKRPALVFDIDEIWLPNLGSHHGRYSC